MKYNKSFSGEPFENYRKYLETIKEKMPHPLYDFVSNSKRHDLEEQSLHDSWINEIIVKVVRNEENRYLQKETVIKIELLAPYHDRTFILTFNRVRSYQFGTDRYGQGDLITYEIYHETFEEEDFLVFNAEFADEREIFIEAEEISIIENFL